MIELKDCDKIVTDQGAFYLGPSTKEYSEGYLELNPHTSLTLHNRIGGIEHLTQIKGKSVMIVFDKASGTNHLLEEGDELSLSPEGIWHIHANPFEEKCITYWYFDGDIQHIIEDIREGKE